MNGQWNIPALINLIQKTLSSGNDFKDFEVEHNFPLIGRKTMLLNAIQLNLTGSGNKVALLAIQDITQRKEREYKKFYNRLTLALEAGRIGTWEFDLEHNALKWDERMYEIYGITRKSSKLSSQTWFNTLHPEDKTKIKAEFKKFLSRKKTLDIEYRIVHPTGEIHFVHTRATMVYDDAGLKKTLVIGTTLDVTEEKTLTNELTHEKKKLLHTLHERDQVNRELESFAYVASHDLKAPLRGIESLTTWIEKDNQNKLTNDSKENLDLLRSRVNRMSNLIDGILRYSRAGRIDGNLTTVSIKELLDEIIDDLAPPKTFTIQYSKKLPTFKTARLPLSQVFCNLIMNAIKYNNRKNGRIKIEVKDKKDLYEFSVTDNGPGIEPGYHEKIFQIFQTLQSKDQVESTGIGLSIVKKIVELNQGKVSVESIFGKSTTFRFTWPKTIKHYGE